MSRDDAKKWYNPRIGDPQTQYISPDDAKQALHQTYADMGDVIQFGDGINGINGHLYTPDPYFADVDAATFVGLNPVGWLDRGLVVADTEAISDHGILSGLGDDDHPHYLTAARGDARYPSRAEMQVIDDDLGTLEGAFDAHEAAADPHVQYQKESEKGQANGYAPLDAQGLLPVAHVPPLTVNEIFTVDSEAEMLALIAERGDMAIRTDNDTTMVLAAEPAAVLANWKAVSAAGQVLSVNGQVGAVTLGAADVGADATGTAATAVTSHEAAGDPHPQYLTAPEAPQPATATPGQSNTTAGQVGTSALYAREDHRHQVPTASAVALGAVAGPGVGSSLSRADHVHPYPSAANVGAEAAGTAAAAISAHGVEADPHSPYFNQTRGDARYSQTGHTHASSGHTIQDEGTPLTTRGGLNFVGSGVTASDDVGNNRTNVTINTAAPGVTDHGALTGLGDDDHPQYVKDTGDTITGKVTVENSSTVQQGVVVNRTVVSTQEADAAILEVQYLGLPVMEVTALGTDIKNSVTVPTPTLDAQAANKNYVDGKITTHESAGDPHSQYLTSAEAPQPSSVAPQNTNALAAAVGTALAYAREDHKHYTQVGAPVALGAALANGTSNFMARADHVHSYPTAAQVGAAETGHTHAPSGGAVGTFVAGTTDGSVIAAGVKKAYWNVPVAGTVTRWRLISDAVTSASVDVVKSSAMPTFALLGNATLAAEQVSSGVVSWAVLKDDILAPR